MDLKYRKYLIISGIVFFGFIFFVVPELDTPSFSDFWEKPASEMRVKDFFTIGLWLMAIYSLFK